MYDATSYYGRRGVVIHAISAIDIALWDIRGKAAGKPVVEMLGGKKRDRVKAYGTIYPLGGTPDEVRANIDRGLDLGLKAIKIVAEPFWRDDFASAETLIRAARDHVGGDIDLMIDAAAAWDIPEHGLPLMPVFRDCGFLWVEAPLPLDDVAGHAKFQGFGVPIGGGDLGATTRFDYEALFDHGTDRHRATGRDHGGRPDRTQTDRRSRQGARQARRATRLQEQHHDRLQSRLPRSALA